MPTLQTPAVPATIWPVERHAQPEDVNRFYRAGEAPILAIITDTGEASVGPIGWIAAAKILQWARAIEIQSDDLAANTAIAAKAAEKYRRALLIRTSFQYVTAWRRAAEFAGCRRFLPLPPGSAKPSKRRGA